MNPFDAADMPLSIPRDTRRRLADDLNWLHGSPHTVAGMLASLRSGVRSVHQEPELTNEAKARRTSTIETESARQLANITERTERTKRRVTETLAGLALVETADTNEALLRETRESRAWRRVERLIEGSNDVPGTAKEAADAARRGKDRTTLTAMRAELPSMLTGAGHPEAERVDVVQHVEALERELLSPDERWVREVADTIGSWQPNIEWTLGAADAEIHGRVGSNPNLLAADGTTFDVGDARNE